MIFENLRKTKKHDILDFSRRVMLYLPNIFSIFPRFANDYRKWAKKQQFFGSLFGFFSYSWKNIRTYQTKDLSFIHDNLPSLERKVILSMKEVAEDLANEFLMVKMNK